MFKKEKKTSSVKQIVHMYSTYMYNVYHIIYSIVVSILYVISSASVIRMYRAVQRGIYSSITYVHSIVLYIVKREEKGGETGRKGCDCNRCLHPISKNQFLQVYTADTQHSTKQSIQSIENSITQHVCHIIHIMLNSITRSYWVAAYFTQSLYRCIDTTHMYNSMTRGQRTTYNPVVSILPSQSYSTDLKTKRGRDHHFPTHQNLFSKYLFRGPFPYTILFSYICTYTIYRYFYLQNIFSSFYLNTLSSFLYMCIRINPKKFYKKLFEKANFGYSVYNIVGNQNNFYYGIG